MYYRQSARVSPRHRSHYHRNNLTTNTYVQSFLLGLRRIRRYCRPIIPIFFRFLIVFFTSIQLCSGDQIFHSTFLPILSRFFVITGILSSMFSVIFFDFRLFNFLIILSILFKLTFDLHFYHSNRQVIQSFTSVCFHITPILFSIIVGRRRSITKPIALRHTKFETSIKDYYIQTFKTIRHVDFLEAATRIQTCILIIDYSLSNNQLGYTAFFITLPFAICFLFGYFTKRNGIILLLLLASFAIGNNVSPILGFDIFKSATTIISTILSMIVGPGALAIDEWLATTNQLGY